ncbi:MAG: endonuclease [Actinoallomurus sp.]|nr:endonuclease [Actinoallomurus sp.]
MESPAFRAGEDVNEETVPVRWFDDAVEMDVSHLEGVPGAALAALLADTDPAGLDGDGLLTAISAWRRLGSWAKAGELAAVAAFLDRRTNGSSGNQAFESAVSELQLELTLTGVGVGRLLELACPLSDRLPGTLNALRCGDIDEAKAQVIARAVDGVVDAATAGAVERQVLPKAPAQTTGQLRHVVERAVIQADPEAAERRRRRAEAGRRVEIRPTDAHTADLCGRDLPADQALAADNRITALAKAREHDGDPGSLGFLRAQVFLGLLLGTGPTPAWPPARDLPDQPVDDLTDDMTDERRCGPGSRSGPGRDRDPGAGPVLPGSTARSGAGVIGTVHVIIPIDTLRGISEQPGEVPGYGAVPASVARTIAARATGQRWCYSIVDHTGQAIRHGHTKVRISDTGQTLTDIAGQADETTYQCGTEIGRAAASGSPQPAESNYRPSGTLRHLIETRDRTCRFPGCRRPAPRCDLDHTRPFHDGGPTCACNLAPLCRKHHRLKQTQGWKLTQPLPGQLIWVTPSGSRYPVAPDPYA